MSPRPILHLVDGTGLVHRSFFAVRGLTTKTGQPTGAIYGFINTIRALMGIEQPTHFVVTFDVSGSTSREVAFPEYKAHRPKMDEDLASQLPFIDKACDVLRLPVVTARGFEADDVIATLTRQAVERGFDVVIITSDKDLLQLVTDRVSVLSPGRDGKPEKRYDREGVIEKMGVPPERVVDLLALVGDAVDNIPGVPGIGDKGARDLLQQFGSLDELLARAGEVKRAAYRDGLLQNADKAHLSRKLATLDDQVPVTFDPEASVVAKPDREAAYQLFKELDFGPFARDMAPEATAFSFSHRVAQNPAELDALIAAARAAGEAAFSLSISSDRPMDAQIQGIALACGDDAAYFAVSEGLPGNVRGLLEDPKVDKWTTCSRRDFVVLGEAGIRLGGRILDASLAAYVLSPGRRGSSVREIAVDEIGLPETADLPNEEGTQASLLADHDAERHAREAAVLVRLAPRLRARLEADGLMDLFLNLEMPLASILAEMERAGVFVDRQALKALSDEIGPEIDQLAQRIYALAGKTFNILSPVQLRQILFEEMGLESGRKTEKTKTLSTADDVLEDLAKEHEFPRLILEYRGITKLRSTYVDALPEMINRRTGRIHASFRQNVAATGRLSATDPNLQNIPIRTALGRRVREAFVAPPGHLLLSADYSQIELRILAHLSEDPILIETFRRGEDVHDRTSLEIFGPATTLPKDEQRRRSKMVNYALLYGKTAFTLAHDIGISRKEADLFIRAYFDRYPKVRGFIDASIEEARRTGMVRTMMGRLRRLPDIQSKNVPARLESERQAVNTRVQGSAADLIKKAMVDLDHALRERKLKTRLISQIHDELLLETPEAEQSEALELVRKTMSEAMVLKVPLDVDAHLGKELVRRALAATKPAPGRATLKPRLAPDLGLSTLLRSMVVPGGSDTHYWREVEDIFASVLDAEPARREEVLKDKCGNRAELRAEVEALLASHDRAGEFIRPRTVSRPDLGASHVSDTFIGTRIGAFRLLERIGDGGMGAVYRAERVEGDFSQQVAIKLIASRLHSAETLRRFRSERQILASLQHPNIVALLDGGITPTGQPYIAMEYVEGAPVTAHCAERRLPILDRIRLFLQVCSAVRYAHRHLVVHRDLKPANVLVTTEGVAKVLDFGIAKLLQEDGAPVEGTGLLLGPLTADYASPEQLRGGVVSTASDVYSLGVMLYELLAGTRPYRTAGRTLDDVLKMVVHEEPPRPSDSTSLDLPYAASHLLGDLDAIILKAMAKEADRRYASAEDLAADLQRYVDGRPVKAQPESRSYVVGKFLNRHRPAALATVVAVVAVLFGLGASLWQGRVARQERDRATAQLRKAQQTAQFLGGIFEKANPVSARGQAVTARDLLDAGALSIDKELKDQPEVKADLLVVIARAYDRLGQRKKALELAEQTLAIRRLAVVPDEAMAESLLLVGRLMRRQGRAAEAAPVLREAIRRYEAALGPEARPVAQCARDLGLALNVLGQVEEAKMLLRRAIAIEERVAPDSASLGLFWSNLGTVLVTSGDEARARDAFERSIQVYERSHEPDSWGIAMPLLSFGDLLRSQEEFARARPLFEKALVVDNETFGAENGSSAYTLGRLGDLALAEGKLEEARDLLDRSLKMWLKAEPASPGVPQTRRFIGRLLIAEGKPMEAKAILEKVLAAWEASPGPEHPDVATVLNDLARAEHAIGGVSRADPLLTRALAIQRKELSPKHPALVPTLIALGQNRLDQKQAAAARPLLEEAVDIARAALSEGHSERLKAEAALRAVDAR